MRRLWWVCIIIIMILVWPQHRYLATDTWRIHKDLSKFHKHDSIPLFRFNDTIIQWHNIRKDDIAFKLLPVFDRALGKFDIHSLDMYVYESPGRFSLSEIYRLPMSKNMADTEALDFAFESRDVHLSPFRRLYVDAGVVWTMGRSPTTYCPYVRRVGTFSDKEYHESHYTFLTPDLWYAIPVVLICVLAFANAYRKASHTDRKPRFPVMYEPGE